MTVFPSQLDDDETIYRIDDNLSEIGTEVINQLRAAVFAIESEIGIGAAGSLTSLADRLSVSLNANGTIKSSALTSVGLVTLPIDNAQIGANAGILESKLALDFSTVDLNAQLVSNTNTLTATAAFTVATNTDLLSHISGATLLSNGSTPGRHVASHIDINAIPSDPRDISFVWTGLIDRDGNIRTATTVAEALLQINNAFVSHELNEEGSAHFASGIAVDTSNFTVIPQNADTVQKSLQAIDDANTIVIQKHQANQHSNGIPRESRSVVLNNVDGYSYNIIPPTPASSYLVNDPATSPVDNNTTGDDIISFSPDNTGNLFDEKFAKVSVGDIVRVNYGNGIEGIFNVESKRHVPGAEWIIRINGKNLSLADGYSSFVRVDKKLFENNNWGTLAIAAANNDIDPSIRSSVIVGNPKGARVLGINFDATQLDSTHFNLYIAMYPTGDPNESEVVLPAIDVTGNAGITPGSYTINTVVQTVNNQFRAGGYNFRFMAFEHNGEFGIMMTDSISNASFSIINGVLSGGSLAQGSFSNNVVGDASDGSDALGFGAVKAAVASPQFSTAYSPASSAAIFPTIIHPPLDRRDYSVNGISRDSFSSTYLTTNDYWDGYISNRVPVGLTTVEVTYEVRGNLSRAELEPGKTITVQPAIDRDDVLFNDIDYGRFIIKSISFNKCDCEDEATSITVINGLHSFGTPVGASGAPPLPVRLYFGEDSVGFNFSNVIDGINANPYIRYHEIFATENGKTFSHERARMPVQTETSVLLNTTSGFEIIDVSKKLKGFSDTGATDFKRYVRFYVLNYDATSGEFDGYIGKRVGASNIEDYGRITRVRKNVVGRFYDSSDVDYIDIKYIENSQLPGTAVSSTAAPRFVDIEIFPTLTTNQENILLAGCNLVSNRVSSITDLREFGNVSEIDFTDSAIRFIESGDRYLHENGVIAGLTYVEEVLPGTLKFNGGMALVDGHIATIGASVISIPEVVRDTGASHDATLDWVICINKNGLLEALPLTISKEHFFARRLSDTDNYYIQSVTFDEIVANRKDLAILAIANVTIASITVNIVYDARKFAGSDYGTYTVSSVSGYDGYNTTFRSSAALQSWVTWSSIPEYKIKYMELDTSISLRSNLVPFKLSGGTVVVNSSSGFLLDENASIENIDFVYNSIAIVSPSSLTNITQGSCIYMNNSTGNITIENCRFRQTTTGERAPYIGYYQTSSTAPMISNVKIRDNKFEESSNSLNCAIIFATIVSTVAVYFTNIDISNNIIEGQQSIILASNSSNEKPIMKHVVIKNNYMEDGVIGYNTATDIPAIPNGNINASIKIIENTCHTIMTATMQGIFQAGGYGTSGNELIVGNICARIYIYAATNNNGTIIKENKMYPRPHVVDWASITLLDIGIYVFSGGHNIISNNIIHYNALDTLSYESGIVGTGNCLIEGNFLNDLSFTNIGIQTSSFSIVRGNHINRGNQDIIYYISLSGSVITCKDNILDFRFVDIAGTNSVTINHTDEQYVTGNINHIKTIVPDPSVGIWGRTSILSISPNEYGITPIPDAFFTSLTLHATLAYINIDANTSNLGAGWKVSLNDILPDGARLISFSFDVSWSSGSGTMANVQARARLIEGANTVILDSGAVNANTEGATVSVVMSGNADIVNRYIFAELTANNGGGTSDPATVTFSNMSLSYTF